MPNLQTGCGTASGRGNDMSQVRAHVPPERLAEMGGGGYSPPPNPKGFYFGFQFTVFEDRQGIKTAFKLRILKVYLERVIFLKRNNNWGNGNSEFTPKFPLADSFVKIPKGKILGAEDI